MSTKKLVEIGFEMLALGSPVEFMESYEFRLLANMIVSAKKQIPSNIPLHLFGAGHPLTIPLAVALGCDTFDSASYMLYAKNGRYISEDRTFHLSKITNFSCLCEVCSKYTPNEIQSLPEEEKINKLALHNLISIKAEVDRVKEAIHEGRLWEYVIKKARAHPRLYETIEVFTANPKFFTKSTPKFKSSAIFLFSKEDQFRPEVISYHNTVRKFRTKKKTLVISGEPILKPYYLSQEYQILKKKFKNSDDVQFCQYNPFLGIIPLEISDIYPAAHYVMSNSSFLPEQYTIFNQTWKTFFEKNNFSVVYLKKNDEFIKFFSKTIPKGTKKKFYN